MAHPTDDHDDQCPGQSLTVARPPADSRRSGGLRLRLAGGGVRLGVGCRRRRGAGTGPGVWPPLAPARGTPRRHDDSDTGTGKFMFNLTLKLTGSLAAA